MDKRKTCINTPVAHLPGACPPCSSVSLEVNAQVARVVRHNPKMVEAYNLAFAALQETMPGLKGNQISITLTFDL